MGMLAIKFGLVIVFSLNLILSTYAQRRITNGQVVESEKKYVVYLLKASVSPQKYDAWLCGGALVSSEFIVTSAACVEDVQHLYAVAGYNKYTPYQESQLDPCTREKKKKIVFICVPKGYDLVYERLEKWSFIDIAVVRVESPFDFNDVTYEQLCSYIPAPITVNYEHRYQEPGLDTLTFGWGHKEIWRNPNDAKDHNEKSLQYASALIMKKQECKAIYQQFQHKMDTIIDKYMICTLEHGNLNDAGELVNHARPAKLLEGCVTRMQRMRGMKGPLCPEPNRDSNLYEDEAGIIDETRRNNFDGSETNYRRNGICQNDHGGPLVTWVGSHEILIGVASVFRVNNESKCGGPYLYTSTQCNGAFLDCILNSKSGRRESCDGPPAERGFDMYEKDISWIGHPDGPAENEIIQQQEKELQPQRFKKPPLRTQDIQQREPVERESMEQLFSELQVTDQQSPERQLPEQQLSGRQLPGQHLPGRQLPGPQLSGRQLPERQLPKQQSPQQQKPWRQSPDRQLQERQLRENKLRNQQLHTQQVPEHVSAEMQLQEQRLKKQQFQDQQFQDQQFEERQSQEQQLQEQQLLEQQLPERQSQDQQFQEQQFQEQQLQGRQFQGQPYQEQQLQRQQFQNQPFKEQHLQGQQLPKQHLQRQQLQKQQIQEQQYQDQQLQEQPFQEQQIQEQQRLQEQRLPEQQLPEQQSSDLQLPELLSGLELPDQESEEQVFRRPAYNGGDPSEEQLDPLF